MSEIDREGLPNKPLALFKWGDGRTTFTTVTRVSTEEETGQTGSDDNVKINFAPEQPLIIKNRTLERSDVLSKPINRPLYSDSETTSDDY